MLRRMSVLVVLVVVCFAGWYYATLRPTPPAVVQEATPSVGASPVSTEPVVTTRDLVEPVPREVLPASTTPGAEAEANAAVVVGKLVTEDATPIKSGMIQLLRIEDDWKKAVTSAPTGDDGAFAVKHVAPGRYALGLGDDFLFESPSKFDLVLKAPLQFDVAADERKDLGDIVAVVGGVITGTVLELETGQPVEGASPSGFPVDGGLMRRSEPTGADGVYRIEGCVTGSYEVSANAPSGYATESFQSNRIVQVAVGEVTESVNFNVTRGGVIAGVVVDTQGGPVPDADVYALGRNSTGLDQATKSDKLGAFSFERIAFGENLDFVAKKDTTVSDLVPCSLGEGSIELVLRPQVTIAGHVEDKTGRRLAGATVVAQPFQKGHRMPTMVRIATTTDDAGAFVLDGIPEGDCLVHAFVQDENEAPILEEPEFNEETVLQELRKRVEQESGHAMSEEEFTQLKADLAEAREELPVFERKEIPFRGGMRWGASGNSLDEMVALRAGERREGVVLKIGSNTPLAKYSGEFSIAGTVVDGDGKGIAGAQVQLMPPEADRPDRGRILPVAMVTTDDDGRFEFVELAKNEYEVSAYHEKHDSDWENVRAPAGEQNLRIVLQAQVTIRGRVVDATSGAAIKLFDVQAGNARAEFAWKTVVDESGSFILPGITPDANCVFARSRGYDDAVVEIKPVSEGGMSEEVIVKLHTAGPLTGTVVDADGNPVERAIVSYRGPNAPETQSDSDGRFSLPQIRGSELLVHHADYVDAHVEVPESTSDISITLERGGSVAGEVTIQGEPVLNVNVWARRAGSDVDEDMPNLIGITDSVGQFRSSALEPGKYAIIAEYEQAGSESGPRLGAIGEATVTAGETVEVNLEITGISEEQFAAVFGE